MANYRAIATVCESIVKLLRSNYQPNLFNNKLEFKATLTMISPTQWMPESHCSCTAFCPMASAAFPAAA